MLFTPLSLVHPWQPHLIYVMLWVGRPTWITDSQDVNRGKLNESWDSKCIKIQQNSSETHQNQIQVRWEIFQSCTSWKEQQNNVKVGYSTSKTQKLEQVGFSVMGQPSWYSQIELCCCWRETWSGVWTETVHGPLQRQPFSSCACSWQELGGGCLWCETYRLYSFF